LLRNNSAIDDHNTSTNQSIDTKIQLFNRFLLERLSQVLQFCLNHYRDIYLQELTPQAATIGGARQESLTDTTDLTVTSLTLVDDDSYSSTVTPSLQSSNELGDIVRAQFALFCTFTNTCTQCSHQFDEISNTPSLYHTLSYPSGKSSTTVM
jgi:hypothetical protein